MIKTQAGFATVWGIIIVMVLVIMSTGIWLMVNSETRMAYLGRDFLEAEYAAESGAKRAVIEFLKVNSGGTPDFGWLNIDQPFINDVTTKKYRVIVYSADDTTKTNVTPDFTTTHNYVIQSTGTVANVTKVVSVSVKVTGGGGNKYVSGEVFKKYCVYSKGNFTAWGGAGAVINGDVGTIGSSVNIQSYNRFITGIVYTSTTPTYWFQNPPAAGWYVLKSASEVGSFTYSVPDVPATPTGTPSGTLLESSYYQVTKTLSGSYYTTGGCTLTSSNFSVSSGQALTLYINGDLHLTNSSISGDNITIYVSGQVTMDNGSNIKKATSSSNTDQLNIYSIGDLKLSGASAIRNNNATIYANNITLSDDNNTITVSNSTTNSKLNLYVKNVLAVSHSCSINGDSIWIQAGSTSDQAVQFSVASTMNQGSTTAVAQVFSKGGIAFSNDCIVGGSANLIVTTGRVNLSNYVNASSTLFLADGSGSGESYVGGTVKIAGFYTLGSLRIAESPTITYSSSVVKSFGLDGSGTLSVEIVAGSWATH